MKDHLFEMLLNLFEKSLAQLQESHKATEQEATEEINESESQESSDHFLYLKPAHEHSMRVFLYEEQVKLTKPSYQFLMRVKQWGFINDLQFETIMNQLQNSESPIVNLQETKWTIRNVLANDLSEEQIAFLDLVLYQKEDAFIAH